MLKHMEKLAELKRAKLLALSLLLIAAAIFITTLALPPSPWVGALKAISEAAMVGALADWFAVVALFRRIPLPFVARHTAIIPRNKDRIADNLGRFVEEKFLDTPSLVALIRRYQGHSDNMLTDGDITLNLQTQQVLRQSQPVEVTPKEFALLTRLIMRSGQTVHRETLQQDIYSWQDDPGSNTLEVHIHNLRRKLGKDRIKTVRGVGYRLESQK